MKGQLVYVELKTGYSDNGPAWIGKALFSRTRETIYFNGLSFLKGARRSGGNYLERFSGDSYWISGVKKDGTNRHWAGGGKIQIDKDVVVEYLELTNQSKLQSHLFEIVELNNNPPINEFHEIENRKLSN
ncbi:MAG: hypothetical protein JO080_16225 [Mucilaginibacter sp.]|nr:hypothetical protein [Mucilaginibacter sp.]